jgi:hypothetical protein
MVSNSFKELLESDVRYMWLAGGLKPDFHTIARFKKDKFEFLGYLFADSVRLCHRRPIQGTCEACFSFLYCWCCWRYKYRC